MRIMDLLRMSWGQIVRRKMVTLLCMIGLSVGCAAIIMAISIAASAQKYNQAQLNSQYKMDEISVSPNTVGSSGGRSSGSESKAFDRGAITMQKLEVIKGMAHVTAVLPTLKLGNVEMLAQDGKLSNVEVIGTELASLAQFGYKFDRGGISGHAGTAIADYGATFGMADPAVMKALTDKLMQDSFNDELYLEYEKLMREPSELFQRQINFRYNVTTNDGGAAAYRVSTPLRVSGVLKVKDGSSEDYAIYEKSVYVSIDAAKQLQSQFGLSDASSSLTKFDSLMVKVEDKRYVKQVEEQIKKLFLNTQSNLFQEESLQQKFALYKRVALGIGAFILMLASLSIFVAMTMSTHQRRRQIGVMKILGANLGQIRQLFMAEAAVLGVLGGAAGLLFSSVIVWIANKAIASGLLSIGPQAIAVPVSALASGLVFAVLTGVISGIYPAISASRTNALEVIKNG